MPKQTDRPEPLTVPETGFESIFDGKTLNGWQGDPQYWTVADGAMVGQITPETIIKSNTFIIWQGGSPADFELKLEYKITAAGNSGINYRSVVIPDPVTPANKFAMRGYQCDIDGGNRYTGNNYEEKGRLFLGVRGQVTRVTGTAKPVILSTFADSKELAPVLTPDWNAVHIIARGATLTHIINNRLMCMVIDDDPKRSAEGQIGVQVHVGGPMRVEYRNWRLKQL
ncbi:MAG TPA: DUF1080 domain-containing protein [Bryobacteraceae bacterium]|nr:DUF1080 domain-containing protein [Bryobacteraceae bacterium]